MTLLESICKNCGKQFKYYTGSSKGVFCSNECYKQFYSKKILTCKNCNKKFKVQRGSSQIFCSRKCYEASRKIERINIKCSICKKVIHSSKQKVEKYHQKYCSVKCASIGKKKERINKKCLECGKEFEDYFLGKHIFCSKECWRKNSRREKIIKICLQCKKEFVFKKSVKYTRKKNIRKFCSKKCSCEYAILNNVPSRGKLGRRSDLNNQLFRSSWEANFARICNYYGTKWIYEPEKIYLPELQRYYYPDFYLPEINCYVEISGYVTKQKNIKLTSFKKNYPEKTIFHITNNDWYKYFRQYFMLIQEWEY